MSRTSHLAYYVFFCALLMLAPVSGWSQDEPAPPTSSLNDKPLEERSLDELESDGFEFGKTKSLTSASTATLIALTGGFFVHGLGHFYTGDNRTGWTLLAIEILSLAAMTTSGIAMVLDGGGGTATGIYAPLFQFGWSTFLGSWVLDIAGSLQGNEHRLEKNSRDERGISLDLYYGYIAANGNPARNVIRGAISFDWSNLSTTVETTQDVLLVTSDYRANVLARLFRVRPQTYVSIEALGDLYNVSDDAPFWRFGTEGRLGGSFDMGHFFRQFDQVAVGAWLGFGNQWYVFDESLRLESDFQQAYISHQAFMHLNLSREVNLKLAYGSHPAAYVPQPTRLLGTTEIDLTYKTDFGSFSVRSEIGDGVAVWIGGAIAL